MTAPAGPSNPNFPPAPTTPEANADADPFKFLTADGIEDMRDEQKRALTEAQLGRDMMDPAQKQEALDEARAKFEEIRKDYLTSFNGLNENDPQYDDYMAVLHRVSFYTGTPEGNNEEGMGDSEWNFGEQAADGSDIPSGRNVIEDLHDEWLKDYKDSLAPPVAPVVASAPVTPPSPDNDQTQQLYHPDQLRDYIDNMDAANEKLTDARTALNEARDKLAALTVKRQGKLSDKANAEYREAAQEYQDAMIAYAKAGEEKLDVQSHNQRTDDEKKAGAVQYLLFEAAELRKVTNEKWDNTTVNKICRWMASGNLAQRIAKGLLVGGGVAAATTALATLTAATGGGALAAAAGTAGGVAALGARMMRTYGAVRGREMLRGRQDTTMTGTGRAGEVATMFRGHEAAVTQLVDTYGGGENGVAIGAVHLQEVHEKAIQAEQKKNRRATYISMGSLVLGAGIATAASEVAEHASGWRSNVQEAIGNGPAHPDVPEPTTPDRGPQIVQQPADPGAEIPGPDLKDLGAKYEAMATIDKGMGGEQLFKELGLKPSDWYKYEDELLKKHPNDFYLMDDGHVGLSHPGKLSDATMLDLATRTGLLK